MGRPVWQLLGMAPPGPLLTTYTLGNAAPGEMAAKAAYYADARAIKIKLVGDKDDALRVAAVRAARPDAWLAVDANRSLTRESLALLLPALQAAAVRLIEQIGRASCRERGCRDGEITVVAVTLKKKNKNTNS